MMSSVQVTCEGGWYDGKEVPFNPDAKGWMGLVNTGTRIIQVHYDARRMNDGTLRLVHREDIDTDW